MENLSNVAHGKTRGSATHLAPSQPVAPHQHLSGCALSTGNVSSVLTPIKESAPLNQTRRSDQIVVKKTQEQFNKELIDEVNRLLSQPNDLTARNMDRGFETVADAIRQLMQELLLVAEQLKEQIENVDLSNTPSTSKYFLDLKHPLHHVKQAIENLKSLESTYDKSAHRQTPGLFSRIRLT
ncbi:hypothetical protein IMW75_11755 [Pseudomonas gregormendelii]|uniref:Uncharacterized protein n=1 Tax=Pseudomonas gregormendelii TaxID=1628277 RepID=A0ABS3AI73_9PSED|nr:hypothetical protein [Pseudomonas gregormendelii]MBN3965949.1 hypothetical protein [Pseudomonas gregormendelii]